MRVGMTETLPGPLRALIVEDEPHIQELVALHLGLAGLLVETAGNGDDALRRLREERFDLIVLDLMLPRTDGLAVCRAIRSEPSTRDVAVLMLTAKREEDDRLLGFESGADDYLTKPFSVRELVARARALLRRARPAAERRSADRDEVIAVGPLRIDRARRLVHVSDRRVDVTPHEFDVLLLLAGQPGVVFSRHRLIEEVWGAGTHVTPRSVDTIVKRLRQKIELDNHAPQLIRTVWGTGYKLADG